MSHASNDRVCFQGPGKQAEIRQEDGVVYTLKNLQDHAWSIKEVLGESHGVDAEFIREFSNDEYFVVFFSKSRVDTENAEDHLELISCSNLVCFRDGVKHSYRDYIFRKV